MGLMIFICFCLGALFALSIAWAVTSDRELNFNSNVTSVGDSSFQPRFEVVKIESSEDGEHFPAAKYTVLNCFHNKENGKDFKYRHYYFYDVMDKYRIGDVLTFTKV